MFELEFAKTEKESIYKYNKYKNKDPFPHILPALLSSGQIQAYIAMTGMTFPYFPSDNSKDERVTSASLIMTIGPEVLFWDEKRTQRYCKKLKKEDSIRLRPNSITFLRPFERFNLPDYIAARFNLRIQHVHRGLLLGTGPLIDPGFKGYPMIPVHNLTENEYVVRVGDEFVNVEFTKIITDANYTYKEENVEIGLPFKYNVNDGKTFDFNFTKYIDKNVPQRKVKSSLSSIIDDARQKLRKFERERRISIIVAVLSAAALIYAGYELTISATNIINNASEKVAIDNIQKEN